MSELKSGRLSSALGAEDCLFSSLEAECPAAQTQHTIWPLLDIMYTPFNRTDTRRSGSYRLKATADAKVYYVLLR